MVAAALIKILGVFSSAPLFSLLAGNRGVAIHSRQLVKVMTMLLLPFVADQVLQGFSRSWVAGHKSLITLMDRISMLFAGAQKSVAMGAPLAKVIFSSAAAGIIILPLVTYHLVQMIVAAPMASWLRAEGEVALAH